MGVHLPGCACCCRWVPPLCSFARRATPAWSTTSPLWKLRPGAQVAVALLRSPFHASAIHSFVRRERGCGGGAGGPEGKGGGAGGERRQRGRECGGGQREETRPACTHRCTAAAARRRSPCCTALRCASPCLASAGADCPERRHQEHDQGEEGGGRRRAERSQGCCCTRQRGQDAKALSANLASSHTLPNCTHPSLHPAGRHGTAGRCGRRRRRRAAGAAAARGCAGASRGNHRLWGAWCCARRRRRPRPREEPWRGWARHQAHQPAAGAGAQEPGGGAGGGEGLSGAAGGGMPPGNNNTSMRRAAQEEAQPCTPAKPPRHRLLALACPLLMPRPTCPRPRLALPARSPPPRRSAAWRT